jgi:hypothetical protein
VQLIHNSDSTLTAKKAEGGKTVFPVLLLMHLGFKTNVFAMKPLLSSIDDNEKFLLTISVKPTERIFL